MKKPSKVVKGMAWSLIERVSMQTCQFIIGIILARLLSPEDYGIIGMLAIFMAVAQSLLDGGFSRALIQKKGRDLKDYSTVFYFNLAISLVLYIILYVISPFIASFYNTPVLTEVTRIVSLVIILNGLSIVQTSKLTIEYEFRSQAIISVISVIISGMLSIMMAYRGFGIWSLVAQSVIAALIRTTLLWLFTKWRPLLIFSLDSFKSLFSFGSKLLVGDIIHTMYSNMYTIVIGKAFNVADVGYYNRANSFAFLPSSIFGQVVNRVMFPLLSENQDDDEVLLTKYSRVLRISMYIYVPIMVALAALSKPIILLLIGEKWIKCLPLMQVLCLGYVFSPLSTLNLNLLYAKGRSDLSLKLDLIKKSIGVLLLLVSIPLGLWLMCVGKALYDFIAFVMNCYYTKKLLNYSFIKQFSDLWIIFVSSTLMFFIIILLSFCFESIWMQLFVGVASGITSYLILTYSLKEPALKEIIEFCVNKRRTT